MQITYDLFCSCCHDRSHVLHHKESRSLVPLQAIEPELHMFRAQRAGTGILFLKTLRIVASLRL